MAYSTKKFETVDFYKATDYEEYATECKWEGKYVIENLPPWIYTRYEQPKSIQEAKAKISNLKHTLADMDIQLEIRQVERTIQHESGEHTRDTEWAEKNKRILKAKQTTGHVLAAYNYYLIMNEETNVTKDKFNCLIKLLIEDPHDFEERVRELLY